jgi:hypothetical protein
MPFLAPDTDLELQKTTPTPNPQLPDQPKPPALDVLAAAERSSNLAGTLYDTLTNLAPNPHTQPGFDPAVSIPKGYESQADLFYDVRSPEDMEIRRQQIDRENQDKQTIAQAGGWGLAASMAAGFTDPLTLASMAIPVGAPTRLLQAGKFAVTAGATTALQEAAMQELQVTRTARDSALNIGASTILGGVLGAVLRPHVAKAAFEDMSDTLHHELNDPAVPGETVLGPTDGRGRIVPETEMPGTPPHPESGVPDFDAEADRAGFGVQTAPTAREAPPGEPMADAATAEAEEPTQTLYHGSPANFDEFSLDHLGERNTAFGKGIYLTDSLEDASTYARTAEDGAGNVYSASVPKALADKFANWSKPIGEQDFPPEVMDVMRDVARAEQARFPLSGDGDPDNWTFGHLYSALTEEFGGSENLKEWLQSQGIHGHTFSGYTEGKLSRNFVVYDPRSIKVTAKNGKPLTTPALGESVPVEKAAQAVEAHLAGRTDIPDETKAGIVDQYRAAAALKPDFDAKVRAISDELGTTHAPMIPDNLKGADRAAEKIMADYGGDPSKIKDLIRATTVIDRPEDAEAAIAAARAKFGEPIALRNSLDPKSEASSPDGYRDAKMNFNVDGHIAELQVNVPEMIAAKNAAHPLYEQARRIYAEAADRDLKPEETAKLRELEEQQKKIYAEAWSFATKERNLASDTNVPLWLKEAPLKRRGEAPSQAVQLKSGSLETGTPSTSAKSVPEGNESGSFIKTSDSTSIAESTPAPAIPDPPLTITEMPVNPSGESTAGAAAVSSPTMRGETIARGARTLVEGPIGRVSPGGRLMSSPSVVSRRLLQEMANLPETTEKNYAGIATTSPVERELWKYEGVHYQGMRARGAQFRAYKERIAGMGTGEQAISREDFMHEIAYAMRRGDRSAIPEVAEAAKQTRAIEFDPLKERAIKAGLLPEGVTPEGADSYLMRQYDARKISGNLTDWMNRLKSGFIAQGVDPAEAADIAHKATRNVLGSERGTMDWKTMDGIVPESGQLKERTLKLPDTLLEPYLNNDIDHVAHSYLRSMAPEVEMTERFGSRDLKDQLAYVRDDYARMIERTPDDAGKQTLQKQMDADLRDLTGVRDRLYGIYGQPKDPGSFFVRAGRLLRSENALRLLGAATLSHFPDLANVMMRYGMPQTVAAMARVLTSKEAFTLTREESKRMGAALDMTMNVTASLLGDYGSHSQYAEQRVANKLTRAFTILTGETPLITATQALTSTLAQHELINTAQTIAKGGKVDSNLLARTAAAGIDQNMLGRIAQQYEQFGAEVNGLHFGMSDQWTDTEAMKAFESAILRDAHSVTLRPGAGDTPLLMSTEIGKTLLQFKSFGYAASRSVLNPMMQGIAHGDPRAAMALMTLVGMGTATYVAKQKAAGQPLEPFNSPRLALEIIDKANLMGWTSEFIFPLLWQAGIKNVSRFGDRDAVETIGGPSAGTIASTYERRLPQKILGNQTDKAETFNRSDLHFLRRLAPGQNLWYLRKAISDTEDAIGDAFDLPGKSNAERAAENATP